MLEARAARPPRRRPRRAARSLLIAGAQWHPGVVGIVAGRIKERFNRPACVGGLADGHRRRAPAAR